MSRPFVSRPFVSRPFVSRRFVSRPCVSPPIISSYIPMNYKSFEMIINGIFTSPLIYCIAVYGNGWLVNEKNLRTSITFTKEDCRELQTL